MKNKPEPQNKTDINLAELARRLGCSYEGDGKVIIRGISSLTTAGPGDIVFYSGPRFKNQLESTKASAVIIPVDESFRKIPVVLSENPYLTFVKAASFFFRPFQPKPGIHPQAAISPSAKIGKNVSIGAFTWVGNKVEIGEGTVIFPLVSIYPGVKIGSHCLLHSHVSIRENCRIGDNVIIHNGVVIGSDGFGFLRDESGHSVKIPQKGIVVIEDEVEIGANTTIDRGALDETRIQKGVKIDNLVQIAHNVNIGAHSILAAQTGIAGSTTVGQKVIMGGQVGITDHAFIGDNVLIAAQTGVTGNIPSGQTVSGSPHLDIREWRKARVSIPRLYELLKEFKRLQKRVDKLDARLGDKGKN
ncbi:MAG: UDP-3-O-(3-hydroxymyristoyl)glucosamine N-acyltransferase [Acidobacteriota bacterium]